MHRRPRAASRLILLLLLLTPGCSYVVHMNRRLNAPEAAAQKRRANATRAAAFASVAPASAPAGSRLRAEPELRGDTAATTRATSGRSGPALADADGCFVGLALSGGGSRSANFAAACMFELQRLGLLQRVDYVSTVSGGSLAGAYYCLSSPDEWNPEAVQRKLGHGFADDVVQGALLPWKSASLALTDTDRSDLLAGSFQKHLFSRGGQGLKFKDLRPDRPRLLINATDLQTGRRFVFCNETFDGINSDLSRFPVAWAAAASSAVPVLLHPVTLRDYSAGPGQYRHLIDGGINDNLGVITLIETYAAHLASARALGRADPYPRGAVFIIIDAHTYHVAQLSDKADVGLIDAVAFAAGLSSTALLNRATSATLGDLIVRNAPDDATAKELREQIERVNDEGFLKLTDRTGHPARVIYVSLPQLAEISDLPSPTFGESVNSIATYFNITPVEVHRLSRAAGLLFRGRFDARVREVMGELGN
jgi:predicted acylesterase/phospholipase RssA